MWFSPFPMVLSFFLKKYFFFSGTDGDKVSKKKIFINETCPEIQPVIFSDSYFYPVVWDNYENKTSMPKGEMSRILNNYSSNESGASVLFLCFFLFDMVDSSFFFFVYLISDVEHPRKCKRSDFATRNTQRQTNHSCTGSNDGNPSIYSADEKFDSNIQVFSKGFISFRVQNFFSYFFFSSFFSVF